MCSDFYPLVAPFIHRHSLELDFEPAMAAKGGLLWSGSTPIEAYVPGCVGSSAVVSEVSELYRNFYHVQRSLLSRGRFH